jgi:hypothetical protein
MTQGKIELSYTGGLPTAEYFASSVSTQLIKVEIGLETYSFGEFEVFPVLSSLTLDFD